MSAEFSKIREYLSAGANNNEPRKIFIFAGNEQWHADVISELLPSFEAQSLWVSDKEIINTCLNEKLIKKIPHTLTKHAHHWLGGEKQIVIFDATEYFDVDAFAAISGIVVGGGIFVILLPAKEKWSEIYSSPFATRLLEHINKESEIVVSQEDAITDFHFAVNKKNPVRNCIPPFLTLEQQSVVELISTDVLEEQKQTFVIISDRGRGKSAALGLLAARLIKSGVKNIAVTAPRLRATDIIFKHLQQQLPDASVTRGCLTFHESTFQFYSPDQLLQDDIDIDLLLVDEAAAIPVPILTACLNKFPQCIFATTVHGYEGTGRGFALRFNKVLEEQKPGWRKLQLQMPIRWPENDLLEKWMFSLLCLNADIVDAELLGSIELEELKHKIISRKQLLTDEKLLDEIFSLLVLAHYRTRPSDLKSLLDDETLSLYVTLKAQHVVAVALVIREGQFAEALSSEVYRGERRPQGHLLAQALTYHCGIEHAATLDYARVMRIAVHPELQQQGIGTQLLDYIVSYERSRGCDAIGTSFGMNKLLLDFWKQAGFDLVRIGFTREQTSGEHAAIMLLPLSHKGVVINLEAARRFNNQISYWLNDVLKDLPDEIKHEFPGSVNKDLTLTTEDKKDLQSFLNTTRNYELCIAALNKLVMKEINVLEQNDYPRELSFILKQKVINNVGWKELSCAAGLTGKEEARALFKKAVMSLVQRTIHL